MANLYSYFAKAVKAADADGASHHANALGKAAGVPGIDSGLRGMAFIDAMLASSGSEIKWHDVPSTNE